MTQPIISIDDKIDFEEIQYVENYRLPERLNIGILTIEEHRFLVRLAHPKPDDFATMGISIKPDMAFAKTYTMVEICYLEPSEMVITTMKPQVLPDRDVMMCRPMHELVYERCPFYMK